jgi:hypothetical protein
MSVPSYKVKALQEGKTIISREPGNSMEPILKSRQPVRIAPATWKDVDVGDIVYCKVHGNFYTHKVVAKNQDRGVQIANNSGHVNGWTFNVYGKVTEILPVEHRGS